jgi:RNA polymerase sigma-32 factor
MTAVRKYKWESGVRLSTYASYWIKSMILDYIVDNWKLVKIATTKAHRKLFFNLRKFKERNQLGLTQEQVEHVADALKVEQTDVREMEMRLFSHDSPMEQESNDDDTNKVSPGDFLEAAGTEPEECIEQQAKRDYISKILPAAIQKLPARSYEIVRDRWLIDEPKSLAELSEIHGVSLQRIQQIEIAALKKLNVMLSTTDNTSSIFQYKPHTSINIA